MTENNFTVFIFMPHKSAVMLKAVLVSIVIMFGLIGGAAAAEGRDVLARADRLYEEGTMESLKLSVKLYTQAAEKTRTVTMRSGRGPDPAAKSPGWQLSGSSITWRRFV